MLNLKLNFTRLTSYVSHLLWRLKKLVIKPKEEPKCQHCGGVLKYHAWSDCSGDRAMAHTASNPPSAKAKAFYDSIGPKARKTEDSDPLHGADRISTAYRGPGGSTITE